MDFSVKNLYLYKCALRHCKHVYNHNKAVNYEISMSSVLREKGLQLFLEGLLYVYMLYQINLKMGDCFIRVTHNNCTHNYINSSYN